MVTCESERVKRCKKMSIHLDEIHNANNKEETLQEYVIFQLTFIVTLPLVTFLILNPTVGIMSSLN